MPPLAQLLIIIIIRTAGRCSLEQKVTQSQVSHLVRKGAKGDRKPALSKIFWNFLHNAGNFIVFIWQFLVISGFLSLRKL